MTGSILVRSLWRELREYGMMMVTLLVIPPLLYAIAGALPTRGQFFELLLLFSGIPVLMALAVLGVHRPISEFGREAVFGKFSGGRPVNEDPYPGLPKDRVAQWVTGMLLPLLLIMILAWWTGFTGELLVNKTFMVTGRPMEMAGIAGWAFLCFYLLTVVIHPVLIVFPLLVFFAVFFGEQINRPLSDGNMEARLLLSASSLTAYLIAGIVSTFLYQVALQRVPKATKALISLVTAFVIVVGAHLPETIDFVRDIHFGDDTFLVGSLSITSKDRSLVCTTHAPDDPEYRGTRLQLQDYRNDNVSTVVLEGWVQPVDFIGHDKVLLSQQRCKENKLRVLVWTPADNDVEEKAALPGSKRFAFKQRYNIQGFASDNPEGRYATLYMSPSADGGGDIWLVDMGKGEGRILIPNTEKRLRQAVWNSDSVYLAGPNLLARVDLQTHQIEKIYRINEEEKGK